MTIDELGKEKQFIKKNTVDLFFHFFHAMIKAKKIFIKRFFWTLSPFSFIEFHLFSYFSRFPLSRCTHITVLVRWKKGAITSIINLIGIQNLWTSEILRLFFESTSLSTCWCSKLSTERTFEGFCSLNDKK